MLTIELFNGEFDGPCCPDCGIPTRLLGTEDHPDRQRLSIQTYVCERCDELLTLTAVAPKLNRDMLVQHLAQTEKHITQGQEHITRQQEIIAKLQSEGRDASPSIALLETFLETQRAHELHRDRILSDLGQAR